MVVDKEEKASVGEGGGLSDEHQSDLPYSLRCLTPNGLPSQGCWRLSTQITILISSDSRRRVYLLAIDKGQEDLAWSKYMLCNWYIYIYIYYQGPGSISICMYILYGGFVIM